MNDISIDWPQDMTFLIGFTGNKERGLYALEELNRVGIYDTHVVWQFPTPYLEWTRQRLPCLMRFKKHPGALNCTFAHYRALKTGYELGMNNILILEDDARFLKGTNYIAEAMSNLPKDWDILMLDSCNRRHKPGVEPGRYWTRLKSTKSTAAYIVNRKAMEKLISLYEAPVLDKSQKLLHSDEYLEDRLLGSDMAIYGAIPNLAIQQATPGEHNYGDAPQIFYRKIHLDISKYADYRPEMTYERC